MIKNGNIILSQSTIKDLGVIVIDDQVELINYCQKQFYHKHVQNDYPRTASKSMKEGLYAETLILGSSARGEVVTSLPEKKRGGKTVTQERIEIQMQRLYGYMYAFGVKINQFNTQIPLIAQYSKGLWLRGELDLFPVFVDGRPSIVDIKTTKDVYSDFFSIDEKWVRKSLYSCWGNYKSLVKNQPIIYHFLARNFQRTGLDGLIRYKPEFEAKFRYLFEQKIDYNDTNFWFFVAGTGKAEYHDQLIRREYDWTPMREMLLHTMVDEAVRRVNDAINTNFSATPTKDVCKLCALKDVCNEFIDEK
jgi:hypothetical protein